MKKIRAIACNHMDLTWRRPFDRDMEFHGQNFVSYAKLEEYYILDNLELAREYPDYKFTIESVEVVRKFLERNPMYEAELKQLYAEGRIHTLFTGNNIVDSNLSSGESIIRNFLYGKRWMKQHMNQEFVCGRMPLAIRHSFRRLCADLAASISEESATAPVMETTGAAWTVRQL